MRPNSLPTRRPVNLQIEVGDSERYYRDEEEPDMTTRNEQSSLGR
jgi:hypothetical protein